jgi:hypothetical protein
MKKTILLLLISSLYFGSYSQTTYKKMLVSDTTTWQHFNCFIPIIANSQQPASPNFGYFPVVAIDTITLNTFKYKKVYELQAFGLNYNNKLLKGYMREDTMAKKVFFKETTTSPDIMLYDFSLNVGDSAYYTFPSSTFNNGYYRVDSIIIKNEVCGARKHYYLWKHSIQNYAGSPKYFEHIESIGSKFHVLYNYNFYVFGQGCWFAQTPQPCTHPWVIGLACKSNNKSKQFQSCTISLVNSCIQAYDSCNYGNVCSGLSNFKLRNDLSFYPNPSSNKVNIKFNSEKSETYTISLFDITGKELLNYKNVLFNTGENIFELNISGIESGVYSVIIENQHFKSSYPVVIQN